MAKEITTSTWCDVCLDGGHAEGGVYTEAETTPPLDLQGTRAKARTLDLCPEHYGELVAPLAEALQAYGATVQPPAVGRPPKARPAAAAAAPTTRGKPGPKGGGMHGNRTRQQRRAIPGPFVCEAPGCAQRRPSANLDAFAQHAKARHGLSLTGYREQYGEPGPGQQGERKGA